MRMHSNQVSNIISGFSFEEPEIQAPSSVSSDIPLMGALEGLDSSTLMTMSKILEAAAMAQKNASKTLLSANSEIFGFANKISVLAGLKTYNSPSKIKKCWRF